MKKNSDDFNNHIFLTKLNHLDVKNDPMHNLTRGSVQQQQAERLTYLLYYLSLDIKTLQLK